MRVIFLDFDGVLIPRSLDPSSDHNNPSKEAISNLNILMQLTKAVAVVSSNWRLFRSVDDLRSLLRGWGFLGAVIDKTPDVADDRGREVSSWLSDHPDVDSFVVLDDDPTDLSELSRNLVIVRPDVGLQWHDVREATRILTGR